MFYKSYYKAGPGVEKDAEPEKGFKKYFRYILVDFWGFAGLSMLYFISCIPIITIGGATMAFNKLCFKVLNGRHVFMLSDFKDAFKENFKRGILLGPVLLFILFDLVILYTNSIMYVNKEVTTGAVAVWAFSLFIAIFIISFINYIIIVSSCLDIDSFLVVVRNSFLLMLAGGIRTLAAAFFDIAVFVLCFNFFPLSGTVMFIGGFYILFFTNCFFISPVIMKHAVKEEASGDE